MATRTIRGLINKLDGTPYSGLPIKFTLQPGTYEAGGGGAYPSQEGSAITDSSGRFAIALWTNEMGAIASSYRCSYAGDSFFFTLPAGNTDIDLGALRSHGVAPFPSPLPPKLSERELFVPTSGQTSFTLRSPPVYPHLSFVWLNGAKCLYVTDYLLDGAVLRWLSPIRLENTDFLEVLY